ncbi:hypothetical protein CDL15_Pgr008215 [Punica granatum]|uniref:Phylloplanin-like n=1 Tax=Punica granatum TaxID=22663 RepID=A0A218VUU7_PUNGR|nr:hypothetical protein CDL15_Pgr008215 [Punica granatum]PKI38792.1 hypothetical protein CRG98_040833 [Punica granatum]
MARSQISFLLLSLLLAAAALPSQAFIIDNTLKTVRVAGKLYCTIDGNPVAGIFNPPLVGANVTVACEDERVTLGQVVTDPAGTVDMLYDTVGDIAFDSSTCRVRVSVANVVGCRILLPSTTLGAPIQVVRFIQDPVTSLVTSVLFGFSKFIVLAS